MKSSLYHLRRAGFTVCLKGGVIAVTPKANVTETVKRFIRTRRDEITNELKAEQQQRELLTAERTVRGIVRQFSNHKEFNHD
jgi:hypothetical protein